MLDREIQRALLEYLKSQYPKHVGANEGKLFELSLPPEKKGNPFVECVKSIFTDPEKVMFHLVYLREHGLIEFGRDAAGFAIRPEVVRITARGIDFLAEDGGPSAILNAKNVKFDVENVRSLVEAGLLRTNVPEEKQGALKKAIMEAPGTVLQAAVSKMVEKGMSDPVGTAKAVAGLFGVSW